MPLLKRLVYITCLLGLVSTVGWGSPPAMADTNPGFTFTWDGDENRKKLNFRLDYGTPGHPSDRYRLRLGVQSLAVSSIFITYPDYYDGTFDPDSVDVRVGGSNSLFLPKRGDKVAIRAVEIDEEAYMIRIDLVEPIPAGNRIEVVLSNVQNPDFGGTYFFNASISTPGDIPLRRYVGTWILSI